MRKVIVTADIEVHTRGCDVCTFEVRQVFYSNKNVEEILEWVDSEADKAIEYVGRGLGMFDVAPDGMVRGAYAIKKNVCIKPVEE